MFCIILLAYKVTNSVFHLVWRQDRETIELADKELEMCIEILCVITEED